MKYHYVYRISNKVLNKHYYGIRGSARPYDDLGVKYFSSSKDKDFIKDQKKNPLNYKYKIIIIYTNRSDAVTLEIKLHNKFDVGVNESFYNCAKQTSIGFDTGGIQYSDAEKEKLYKHRFKEFTEEHKEKIRAALKGKKKPPFSESHKNNIKESRKNQKIANNSVMKIYNENDELAYEVPLEENFELFCEKHNLPFRTLKKSYQRNGSKICYSRGMSKKYWDKINQFENWYCLKIK